MFTKEFTKTYEQILDYVNGLEIIDTHEHLPPFEENRDKSLDFLAEYLLHYFNRDLVSAGVSKQDMAKAKNPKLSLETRWHLLEPYWKYCEYTGYGRAIMRTIKDLYGFSQITEANINEINAKFAKTLNGGQYKRILKEKSKIAISILDSEDFAHDKEFFALAYLVNRFIIPASYEEIRKIETQSELKIHNFCGWLEAVEALVKKAIDEGAVCLKVSIAYSRKLKFNRTTFSDAEADFNKIFSVLNIPDWLTNGFEIGKNFQNYMMHYLVELCANHDIPMQIHTGIQEGNGNILQNSNPALLSNLFLEYPDVAFDIFHIGYPYYLELAALAKNFANVYIDMCWAHIVSPNASVCALCEFIDSVPFNKISAFGGDYVFVDAIYAHQLMARENVSRSLALKTTENVFDTEAAKYIAKMLFFDNPNSLFKLNLQFFSEK